MTASDIIGGFALAVFLALPFGLIGMLFTRLTENPRKYDPNEPLLPPRDLKLTMVMGIMFVALFSIPLAFLFRANRKDAESWQRYARDHRCVVVDQRSRIEYYSGGYPGTSRTETVTEYLWRCEGGNEHWRQ